MNRRKYPRATLSVLALCLFAAVAMLVSPVASGQRETRVNQEISQVLDSFETVTLDPAEVLRSVRESGSVMLQTARGSFDLEVEPYDVRSDDYRAVTAGDGGVMTELPRTPSNSWRGHVRGQEGTVVRLYLDGQKVQGIIITPAETFYLEPARSLSNAASAKEMVFYSAADVKPTDASCEEATLGGKVAAEAARAGVPHAATASSTAPKPDEAFAPMPEARIALEADFEFFNKNVGLGGNAATTEADMRNILTQVDGIYEAQLGVSLRVVFVRIWTNSITGDPYTPTNASAALEEFADVYDGTFGVNGPPSRDLTHMFTGKNLDGSTIGIAYRGVVCNVPDSSYGISESLFVNNTAATRVGVTAHEIGHNFGATHPNQETIPPTNCAGFNIMNSSVQETSTFCQFSRDQITSHIATNSGINAGDPMCLARLTTQGCTYAITPTSQFYSTAGGTGTVNITSNCSWGVAEGAPWVTFNSEAGSGNSSVGFTVAANTNAGPREAIVEIGGQKLSLKQAASSGCGGTQLSFGPSVGASLADSDCRSAQTGRNNSPADIYTFTARANQRVRIEMLAAVKASDFDNLPPDQDPPAEALDTFVYLYGPDGSVVASNDDRSGNPHNTDSSVPVSGFVTLPATGVYTVVATSFEDFDNGNYTIRLTDNASTNSVSLSSAAYTVDEGTGGGGLGTDGTGFRVVTVTRSGTDTTGTATVDYATTDGTASKQKDYTQALGTLVFAPNETSKTFTVFVDDDAFAESAETVTLTLSNPVGTTLGATNTATLTINSNDGASGPSPVRAQSFNTSFFVRQQYLDFLSREPDSSGFNFWQGEINGCGADEQCKEVKRINVSAAFFVSIEFQETGYLVYRTYKAAYGDTTSPNVAGTVPVIRLNEFLPDTQRIGQGVIVGAPNWEQTLDANKNAYALEFVLRQRFLTAFPLSMTAAQYVDKLNLNAGGVLTTAERDALIAQLSSNPNVATSRAAVLRAVAENAALRQNEFRRAFVLMQFYGYLRRNPDDPQDVDFRGWKFWLDKLNQFNGDYIAAEMVKAFLAADEYIDRFGTRP
jgi:hypothetical protein